MQAAGLVGQIDPTLPPQALAAATFEANESVSQFFKANSPVKAVTATYGNPNNIYFRSSGISTITILHESLHSLSGLGDEDLASRLGFPGLTHDAASAAISASLTAHGCGG